MVAAPVAAAGAACATAPAESDPDQLPEIEEDPGEQRVAAAQDVLTSAPLKTQLMPFWPPVKLTCAALLGHVRRGEGAGHLEQVAVDGHDQRHAAVRVPTLREAS